MSTFTVAGVSTQNGVTKVRFANDIVSRTKLLAKGGHSPLELIELPRPMTKGEACAHLLDVGGVFKQYATLITETMGKKVSSGAPKVAKQPKVKAPKVKATPVQKTSSKVKAIEKKIKEEDKDDELLIEELGQALV
jgi:hypothetical protein